MSYEIKNRLGQPITCTLNDGTSFTLISGKSKTIKESQIDDYIRGLVNMGYVRITKIDEDSNAAEKVEAQQKKKGGKDNGDTIKT